MKNLFNRIILLILKVLAGKNFANPLFSLQLQLKHFVIQKIFRINGNVPWPVHWTSKVKCPENIEKGERNPGLAIGCYLDGRNGIKIGRNTWVGPRVSIISMNHDLNNFHRYEESDPIEIGDNCWIATNVTILAGVKLGNHVVIAAGAVVSGSFEEDNILIGGVPAKVIKKLGK